VIAGVIGLIMATPLLAAAIVMIRMWYVEDVLEKRAGQGDGVPAARE
jgi:predicted PurR-regulated permease PerM